MIQPMGSVTASDECEHEVTFMTNPIDESSDAGGAPPPAKSDAVIVQLPSDDERDLDNNDSSADTVDQDDMPEIPLPPNREPVMPDSFEEPIDMKLLRNARNRRMPGRFLMTATLRDIDSLPTDTVHSRLHYLYFLLSRRATPELPTSKRGSRR
jgi:hypothetical protein